MCYLCIQKSVYFFCFYVLFWISGSSLCFFSSIFSYYFATHNYTCSVFVCIHTKIYKSQTRKSIETNSVSLSSVLFFSTLFCPVQCCCIFVLCKNKTELISMDFHPRFVGLWKNIHKYTTGIDVFFVESQRNKCMQLKKWMLYHGRISLFIKIRTVHCAENWHWKLVRFSFLNDCSLFPTTRKNF